MKKIVKKWGASLIIVLDEEMAKIYNIEEKDILEFEIKNVEKRQK